MLHPFKLLCAGIVMAGVALAPALSHAQSAKSEANSAKSESVSDAKKNQASVDEFEENRRAHLQKSKENNANKGAN